MNHNEKLIQIIDHLNTTEPISKKERSSLNKKSNSVKNILEEIPASSDPLKNYLQKYKKFKSNLTETDLKSQLQKEKLHSSIDAVAQRNIEERNSDDLDQYSRSDKRVFQNQAKKKESKTQNNVRLQKYSNSKANLTSDKHLAPLRLARYSQSS